MSVIENGTLELSQTTRLLSDNELDAVSGGIVGGQPVGTRIHLWGGFVALTYNNELVGASTDGGRTWNYG